MAKTKFPKFNTALANDPTTRRLWYGLATAHDFESHDNMTEEKFCLLYTSPSPRDSV